MAKWQQPRYARVRGSRAGGSETGSIMEIGVLRAVSESSGVRASLHDYRMAFMNKEIYTIIGVGVALAALTLGSQAGLRADMRSEHAELRLEIATLRSDLQSEINALRSDMREDFAAVRAEMGDLRTEMGDLTERVIRIEVLHGTSTPEQEAVER